MTPPKVRALKQRRHILPLLETDRIWAAYALGDLDDGLFQQQPAPVILPTDRQVGKVSGGAGSALTPNIKGMSGSHGPNTRTAISIHVRRAAYALTASWIEMCGCGCCACFRPQSA